MGTTSSKEDKKIIILGLRGAGKTTLLYRIKLGKDVYATPTTEFNVENLRFRDMSLEFWDITDRNGSSLSLSVHFPNTAALIYVVNSHAREQIEDAHEQLKGVRSNHLITNIPLLVMANKIDLPNPLSIEEITKKLKLDEIERNKWHIQSTCGKTGEGITESLAWLCSYLGENRCYIATNANVYV